MPYASHRFLHELRICLGLSIPLASAQLAQAMNGMVDMVMMGNLGSQYLAAGGLGATTFNFLLIINSALVSAVSPLASEAVGQADEKRVSTITVQGLWIALFFSMPVMYLLWHGAPLLRLLGQEESIVVLTAQYLQAIAPGYFPALAFVVLRCFVSALSKPQSVMAIMIAGVALNAIANYLFIFGKLGVPALGLMGVGIASSLSFWVMAAALGLYVWGRSPFKAYAIWQQVHVIRWEILWAILTIGLPIAVLAAFEAGLFNITTFLAGQVSTQTLAAHHVALQTAAMCFMVPFGVSQATTVRVGQLMGQRNSADARLAGYAGILIGTLFMAMMAVLIILLPKTIISVYINLNDPGNQEVIEIAVSLLSIAALFQIVDGIQVTALGALRGLQDTRIPMMIGIVAYWGVGFTCSHIAAFRLSMGGVGLWLGLAVGLCLAAIALSWRFHHLMATRIALDKRPAQ